MNQEETNITQMKGGRSFPEAVDGTSESYNERTADGTPGDDDEEQEWEEDEAASIPQPVQGEELNQFLVDQAESYLEKLADRKSVNAELAEILAAVNAKHISKKAFREVLGKIAMSAEQREAHNLHMLITCSALGIPFQMDMFQS